MGAGCAACPLLRRLRAGTVAVLPALSLRWLLTGAAMLLRMQGVLAVVCGVVRVTAVVTVIDLAILSAWVAQLYGLLLVRRGLLLGLVAGIR